jgi:hypothetical protein
VKYMRVRPGDPFYEIIQRELQKGVPICDARTHNSAEGCSNPSCFKFKPKRKR